MEAPQKGQEVALAFKKEESVRWCNWCNLQLGEQERGEYEDGSWFHPNCILPYRHKKGTRVTRSLHLPSIHDLLSKPCADEESEC